MPHPRRIRRLPVWALRIAALAASLAVVACGGGDGEPEPPPGVSQGEFERQLAEASRPTRLDFPAVGGQTLEQIANTVSPGPQVGLATSVLTPGENRLAFGVIGPNNEFLYGKTAVYVAPAPDDVARGPYPAPADSLVTKPAFRSRTAAAEDSPIAAIYAARVPFDKPGRYAVLVLTRTASGMVGATAQVTVQRDTPIPDVGERPPAVSTDTLASAAGNIEAIDTRVPPAEELHRTNFKDVLGKKPVALLFATPQLCQTRVCGPVVDIALQLKQKYGDRMEFIHQEVYVDNQVDKGLRAPLRRFGLETEPWLFTVDRQGRVAARLEGSFGINGFERAIQAALR